LVQYFDFTELACTSSSLFYFWHYVEHRERERFIIRQPLVGENDDYDSENSWILDGIPGSSRRRRRGEGRGEGRECREKWSASGADVGVDSAKPKARSRSREGATLDEAPRISLRVSS